MSALPTLMKTNDRVMVASWLVGSELRMPWQTSRPAYRPYWCAWVTTKSPSLAMPAGRRGASRGQPWESCAGGGRAGETGRARYERTPAQIIDDSANSVEATPATWPIVFWRDGGEVSTETAPGGSAGSSDRTHEIPAAPSDDGPVLFGHEPRRRRVQAAAGRVSRYELRDPIGEVQRQRAAKAQATTARTHEIAIDLRGSAQVGSGSARAHGP